MIKLKHIFLLLFAIFLLWYFTSCSIIDTFSIGVQEFTKITNITNDNIHDAVKLWRTNKPKAINTYGQINAWDTSNVKDMSKLFYDQYDFNDNISNWNTGSVTDMSLMFMGCLFNQNINTNNNGGWDVSKVTDMRSMFNSAIAFNKPLNKWNVGSVTNMSSMFQGARAFNNPLNMWNVSKVKDMTGMFSYSVFDQPLNEWNVSSVTDMSYMFQDANTFNRDISGWEVDKVTNMSGMFENATAFYQNLNCWKVNRIQVDTWYMFYQSKIGNSKKDPISTGCWKNVINGSNCNECIQSYICDGITGNCVYNPYGSKTLSECKSDCLNKNQFKDKYCNDGGENCKSLGVSSNKCNHKILKDPNNNTLDTTDNYCTEYNKGTGTECIGLCNSDKCNRDIILLPLTNCSNHEDDCLKRYDDTEFSTYHRCVNKSGKCENSEMTCTNIN
jgi:surface protein